MRFVVFEGLDGSGKSSLMSTLEQELRSKKIQVLKTREPGGTPLGDEIRELILRSHGQAPTPRTELLLYEASRSQHVDLVIRPHLEKNFWVLCDRFTASSIAFQAGGREIAEEWVEKLNRFATQDLTPDLTVLLDLSVQESQRRRQKRESFSGKVADRMESEADHFHQKVRRSFLDQAHKNPHQWLILDASLELGILTAQLQNHLKGLQWLP